MSEPGCEDPAPKPLQNAEKTVKAMHPNDGFEMRIDFVPTPTDVIICSGPKCGTAWMEQIVHSLRSRGDMDFEEISEIIVCLDFVKAPAYLVLDAPQSFFPRLFATHLPPDLLPKEPCKQIFVTRNPRDSVASFYYFYANWLFNITELTLHEFVEWMVIQERPPNTPFANASQLRHLASWYPHRNDENVLWLHYEDLKEDLVKCIAMISDFLQIGVGDEDLLKLVAEQASFEFMKKHNSKYDLHLLKRRINENLDQPTEDWMSGHPGRVRTGKMNEGSRLLSEEMQKKMDDKWKELVEPVTGYATYEDMRAGINKELGRSFGVDDGIQHEC